MLERLIVFSRVNFRLYIFRWLVRMKSIRIELILMLYVLPIWVTASCPDQMATQIAVKHGYKPENPTYIACKNMPDVPNYKIVSFIEELGIHEFKMTVIVINKTTGLAEFLFIDEDASLWESGDPNNIQIDTGRYFVAPNKRAFGVRVRRSLNYWDSEEYLSLFTLGGEKLLRVVTNLLVASSNIGHCPAGAGHSMHRQIFLSNTSTQGFYDLMIKTRREIYEYSLMTPVNSCTTKEKHIESSTVKLRYVKGAYAFPKDFY